MVPTACFSIRYYMIHLPVYKLQNCTHSCSCENSEHPNLIVFSYLLPSPLPSPPLPSPGPTQRSGNPSSQRQEDASPEGVRPRTEILQKPLSARTLRPVFDQNRQRRHSVGYHSTSHLETAGEAVYETRSLRGVFRLTKQVQKLAGNGHSLIRSRGPGMYTYVVLCVRSCCTQRYHFP